MGKKARKKKQEEQEEKTQSQRARRGAIVYICIDCGGDLVRNKGGPYHPDFLIRKFKCKKCGRETDQYVEERREVRL